jgi:hypothetical protein
MKKKFELEYPINSSAKIIFPRLSTAGGLSEWFADNVIIEGRIFRFVWNGTEQRAEQSYIRENSVVRYDWLDEEEPSFFEFRLKTDELTSELALIIIDFADDDEKSDSSDLWDSQVTRLKHSIGL